MSTVIQISLYILLLFSVGWSCYMIGVLSSRPLKGKVIKCVIWKDNDKRLFRIEKPNRDPLSEELFCGRSLWYFHGVSEDPNNPTAGKIGWFPE